MTANWDAPLIDRLEHRARHGVTRRHGLLRWMHSRLREFGSQFVVLI